MGDQALPVGQNVLQACQQAQIGPEGCSPSLGHGHTRLLQTIFHLPLSTLLQRILFARLQNLLQFHLFL